MCVESTATTTTTTTTTSALMAAPRPIGCTTNKNKHEVEFLKVRDSLLTKLERCRALCRPEEIVSPLVFI